MFKEYTPEEKTRVAENFVYQIIEDIINNDCFSNKTVLTFVYNEDEFAALFNAANEIKRIALEERLTVEFKTFEKNTYMIEVKRLWCIEAALPPFCMQVLKLQKYFL